MNSDIMKAIKEKEKKHRVKEWWNKNGYKVLRIILFPFVIVEKIHDKYNSWAIKRHSWNEERAYDILAYYIPRRSDWNGKKGELYFFDNGLGWYWCVAKKYLRLKDYTFQKLHTGWLGGRMRDYLLNDFELDGFTKQIIDFYDGKTEIIFTLTK